MIGLVTIGLIYGWGDIGGIVGKKVLTIRAVQWWDWLPRDIVDSPLLEAFKQRLGSYLSGVL